MYVYTTCPSTTRAFKHKMIKNFIIIYVFSLFFFLIFQKYQLFSIFIFIVKTDKKSLFHVLYQFPLNRNKNFEQSDDH